MTDRRTLLGRIGAELATYDWPIFFMLFGVPLVMSALALAEWATGIPFTESFRTTP